MFRGAGAETGTGELDLGVGAITVLLALPGTLASLLMFLEYGSLVRFLNGRGDFDPFTTTLPDEYFLIALSAAVTGGAILWRWDSIFLDRRDYTNLVVLPISLRAIFLANLCAILALAGLLTLVVNAVSLVLFPMAVNASQPSFAVALRFAAGHAAAVFMASAFMFCAMFALIGLLMALLPSSIFHRISPILRFLGAAGIVLLLATSFSLTDWLKEPSWLVRLPPISFLGIARTVWGRGNGIVDLAMTRSAAAELALAALTAIVAYSLSFRRSFLRIPEMGDAALPARFVSPWARYHGLTLRLPSQRACYQFAAKTLLRSGTHLQIVLGSAAVGLVLSTHTLASWSERVSTATSAPPLEFLSIPFVMSYCLLIGMRLVFEIPVDVRCNWIFRLWLDPCRDDARAVARRMLLGFPVFWLGPAAFVSILVVWGWRSALLHTAVWAASTVGLVEILIVHFRKIPFTCPYPVFQSSGPVGFLVFLGSFFFFTGYLPRLDRWCLLHPERVLWLVPLVAAAFVALHIHRRQMSDIDKQLIFENTDSDF